MEWTVSAAANEFDSTVETITKGLRRNGIDCSRGQKFTTPLIFRALTGDKDLAQAREAMARAVALERQEREAAGELILLDEAKQGVERIFGPIREALVSLPTAYASRCNPTDPQLARAALEGWVDDTLRHFREVSLLAGKRKRGRPIGRMQLHRG